MITDPKYQPFYCEENIWHLADEPALGGAELRVVVLSNDQPGFAMWNQKASDEQDRAVVWDYHVVLLARCDEVWHVLDLDSRLDGPRPFSEWWRASFPYGREVPHPFLPTFRAIEATRYRRLFSSDRSHMRDGETGEWLKPPPPWEPIYKESRGMNLGEFIDMSADFVGHVLEMQKFEQRFRERTSQAVE